MMLQKSLSLFNEFHGVKAEVMQVSEHHYTLVCQGVMKGFDSESELVHFLLCGTSHLTFMTNSGDYFTAYNLAMMFLNRRCGEGSTLVYSVSTGGKATLWGLNGSGWFKVAEYSCLHALYWDIIGLHGVDKVRKVMKGKTSFLSTLKRLLS